MGGEVWRDVPAYLLVLEEQLVLLDHGVYVGLELAEPAVDHPAGPDLDGLRVLAGGLEDLDAVDQEPLDWVAPALREPAVPRELATEPPLARPGLRADRTSCCLIVKAPRASSSIENSVEASSV